MLAPLSVFMCVCVYWSGCGPPFFNLPVCAALLTHLYTIGSSTSLSPHRCLSSCHQPAVYLPNHCCFNLSGSFPLRLTHCIFPLLLFLHVGIITHLPAFLHVFRPASQQPCSLPVIPCQPYFPSLPPAYTSHAPLLSSLTPDTASCSFPAISPSSIFSFIMKRIFFTNTIVSMSCVWVPPVFMVRRCKSCSWHFLLCL